MPRARLIIALVIFLVAFGVRLLCWHDTRLTVGKVQSSVVQDYQRIGNLLRRDGIRGFFSSSSALADLNNLGHPPGYSVLMAFIQSTTAIQLVQIIFDAGAAVLIFLIVGEVFSTATATVAGALAALSPQLAWNSVLLLPDSLAVFPILLAIYLLARARTKPRLINFILIGVLVGLSCWLRANAMLMTFFLAAAVLLLLQKTRQWQLALAVIGGTLLIILPLTIRNAIVFHRFIPLSLGAGQTLLEGIADYDTQDRFGIPNTDMGIMKQEAEMFQRPDYYGTLFNPDGVKRERARMARGFAVIRSHPLWFSSVMIRRGASMLRLERATLVAVNPAISHLLDANSMGSPISMQTPVDLIQTSFRSPQARVLVEQLNSEFLTIIGDDSKYGAQVSWSPIATRPNMDYVMTIPIKTERGRVRIAIENAAGEIYSSEVVEPIEGKSFQEQPVNLIELPFSKANDSVQLVLTNEASNPPNPVVKIGAIKLYELGPARWLWTRYPRFVVHYIQRLFLTAIILPLAILGFSIVIVRKQNAALLILSVVPVYYFCVQSAFHTEYRYVLAVNYFVFAFAAIAITWIASSIKTKILSLPRASSRLSR